MKKAIAIVAALSSAVSAQPLPAGIAGQLPPGYAILASAKVSAGRPTRRFIVVALGRRNEAADRSGGAPTRPLLIFGQRGERFVPAGRNDHVVMKADEGGQCDPFLDGGATIATKGRYFTIENGVACGQHWTDYITFRLDDRSGGFVFDNERSESWSMNPSSAPDAEALVRDSPPHVVRDRPDHITPFAAWRPKD